jgi:hypothetical protein
MVFNASFNNISITTWRSVLFVEETGVPAKTTKLTQDPTFITLCCVEYTSHERDSNSQL